MPTFTLANMANNAGSYVYFRWKFSLRIRTQPSFTFWNDIRFNVSPSNSVCNFVALKKTKTKTKFNTTRRASFIATSSHTTCCVYAYVRAYFCFVAKSNAYNPVRDKIGENRTWHNLGHLQTPIRCFDSCIFLVANSISTQCVHSNFIRFLTILQHKWQCAA